MKNIHTTSQVDTPRIHILSPHIANQIAAGEIIERPASVVKELLENAHDAKATEITIDIGFGGLNHISVQDNGVGILKEDLPLAIHPHATSKIMHPEDLHGITSLGFRGEALASIGSVSKLSICSKPAEQSHGMLMTYGLDDVQIIPAPRTQGTTITASDIFYNQPVRKQFLRDARCEYGAIEKVAQGFALSAPHISVTMIHNNKVNWVLPRADDAATRQKRIMQVLGKAFMESCLSIDHTQGTYGISGYVSQPTLHRSTHDKQWVFVNGRMVRDKLIQHAIRQVYEALLPKGRCSLYVLYIEVPHREVDVNVHPTKHELRFVEPRVIHDFIDIHLRKTLIQETPSDTGIAGEEAERLYFGVQTSPWVSTPQVVDTTRPYPSKTPFHWSVIDAGWICIQYHNKIYIADIHAIYRHWLRHYITNTPAPMPSRNLLVPVTISLRYALTTEDQAALEALGITYSYVDDGTIWVRSIPQAMPYLDITALFSNSKNESSWIDACLRSQNMDGQPLEEEMVSTLIGYVESLPSSVRDTIFRHLNAELCREMLDA